MQKICGKNTLFEKMALGKKNTEVNDYGKSKSRLCLLQKGEQGHKGVHMKQDIKIKLLCNE